MRDILESVLQAKVLTIFIYVLKGLIYGYFFAFCPDDSL